MRVGADSYRVNTSIFREYSSSHPFVKAIESGNEQQVYVELLTRGADPNGVVCEWLGEKVLNLACMQGAPEVVKALLDFGAEVNSQSGKEFFSPLHRACLAKQPLIVQLLVDYKANVRLRSADDRTALMEAIHCLECCKILVSSGAEINIICADDYGSSPLIEACYHGYTDLVRLLVNSGADVNLRSITTPLNNAVYHPEILSILLEKGPDVSCVSHQMDFTGFQPLHEAAFIGLSTSVELLLISGADPQARAGVSRLVQSRYPLDIAKEVLEDMRSRIVGYAEENHIILELEKVVHLLTEALKKSQIVVGR